LSDKEKTLVAQIKRLEINVFCRI